MKNGNELVWIAHHWYLSNCQQQGSGNFLNAFSFFFFFSFLFCCGWDLKKKANLSAGTPLHFTLAYIWKGQNCTMWSLFQVAFDVTQDGEHSVLWNITVKGSDATDICFTYSSYSTAVFQCYFFLYLFNVDILWVRFLRQASLVLQGFSLFSPKTMIRWTGTLSKVSPALTLCRIGATENRWMDGYVLFLHFSLFCFQPGNELHLQLNKRRSAATEFTGSIEGRWRLVKVFITVHLAGNKEL